MHKKKSHQRTTKVGIRELRGNLSGYVKRARNGQIIEVTSHDEVVAELHPVVPPVHARRKPGTLKGKIRIAPDFDKPPAELLDAFEA